MACRSRFDRRTAGRVTRSASSELFRDCLARNWLVGIGFCYLGSSGFRARHDLEARVEIDNSRSELLQDAWVALNLRHSIRNLGVKRFRPPANGRPPRACLSAHPACIATALCPWDGSAPSMALCYFYRPRTMTFQRQMTRHGEGCSCSRKRLNEVTTCRQWSSPRVLTAGHPLVSASDSLLFQIDHLMDLSFDLHQRMLWAASASVSQGGLFSREIAKGCPHRNLQTRPEAERRKVINLSSDRPRRDNGYRVGYSSQNQLPSETFPVHVTSALDRCHQPAQRSSFHPTSQCSPPSARPHHSLIAPTTASSPRSRPPSARLNPHSGSCSVGCPTFPRFRALALLRRLLSVLVASPRHAGVRETFTQAENRGAKPRL